MARIISIDYGLKRTGIAVTDPLQIIATGLTTVSTGELMTFLKKYCAAEQVALFLVGLPLNLDDSPTHSTPAVELFIAALKRVFPAIPVTTFDERFTSKLAKNAMLEMGLKKQQRRNKALVDEIAATIMLQEYLNMQ